MTHVFRPSARIEIAGQSLSAAEAGLISVEAALSQGGHDGARLTLWPRSKFASAAPGDPATLALGPLDDEVLVLTGTVSVSGGGASGHVVEIEESAAQLSRKRVAQAFAEMGSADIAGQLAQTAGVSIDAETGGTLAAFYLDPARTVWDGLGDLARLSGMILVTKADGGLVMRAPGGGETHTLRYGAELIDWRLERRAAPVAIAVGAHGDGGAGYWHWVAPDPLGNAPAASVIAGAVTDRDGADRGSQGYAAAAAAAGVGGWITISGAPEIRPGDGVTVTDLPGAGGGGLAGALGALAGGSGGGADPGPLTVLGVRHGLDGARGFLTTLRVASADTGGGLGGLIGGLI